MPLGGASPASLKSTMLQPGFDQRVCGLLCRVRLRELSDERKFLSADLQRRKRECHNAQPDLAGAIPRKMHKLLHALPYPIIPATHSLPCSTSKEGYEKVTLVCLVGMHLLHSSEGRVKRCNADWGSSAYDRGRQHSCWRWSSDLPYADAPKLRSGGERLSLDLSRSLRSTGILQFGGESSQGKDALLQFASMVFSHFRERRFPARRR